MEKGAGVLMIVLTILMVGILLYFVIESKSTESFSDGRVPYSNIAPGFFYELTPQSILDNKDIEFWSKNKIVKKQFFMDTKFGQTKENNNLFNYTLSDAEDCEKEFDKKNYSIPMYYQATSLGSDKYNLYTARSCWIESVTPIKLECKGEGTNQSCLYNSKVSCICLYATEA